MTTNICQHCGRGLMTTEEMHSAMCSFCLAGETKEVQAGYSIYVDPLKLVERDDGHKCEHCGRMIFGFPDAAYCESCAEIFVEDEGEGDDE